MRRRRGSCAAGRLAEALPPTAAPRHSRHTPSPLPLPGDFLTCQLKPLLVWPVAISAVNTKRHLQKQTEAMAENWSLSPKTRSPGGAVALAGQWSTGEMHNGKWSTSKSRAAICSRAPTGGLQAVTQRTVTQIKSRPNS